MPDETTSRGEQTQAEILQAALQLFLTQGFHGTSMRQIAHQAGIALGSIYNHFPGKEELFIRVLLENHPYHQVISEVHKARGRTTPELLRDAAHRIVSILGPDLAFVNLLLIELVEFNGTHVPELFEIIFPEAVTFSEQFVAGRDDLRPIPVPILIRAFIGLLISYALTEELLAPQMPPGLQSDTLDTFIDIFLHGVFMESSQPSR